MAFNRALNRATRRYRVRRKITGSDAMPRLSIYRSLHHIYAQVISDETGRTLVSMSTMNADVKGSVKTKHNKEAAKSVGKAIAARCLEKGIQHVVFDRNGFLYHGRVKALADAAREAGLK